MANSTQNSPSYSPDIKRNKGMSPLWLLPILALILSGWLVLKAINDAGERIQIHFSDAQGLIAGRTTIRYHGLEVGIVRDIKLSDDLSNIYVEADIYPEATKLLSRDTLFWMVKPTASLSGISGLDALVSGNYIAIQPGDESSEPETKFNALERPPADIRAPSGLNITLRADDLGGISIGSQIVYRKIPIGEVYSYQLDGNEKNVLIHASIQDEYRSIITDESRFWNVSGLGATLGVHGVDLKLDSLSSLIGGSIAVDSPDGGEPVSDNSRFRLYPDLKTAGRGIPIKITLPDDNRINPAGAPIMYRGIAIGQITDLQFSNGRKDIVALAAIEPVFSDMLTTGSHFILEEAKVSLSGIENVTNLLKGNYLTLIAGKGDKSRYFTALKKDEFHQKQSNSTFITLIAENSFGLEVGDNVLFKGISVGEVTKVSLVKNKVHIALHIGSDYASLIKSENRFYVTGSATVELTESGLNVSVPPAKQLLTGSISFTSEGTRSSKKQYTLYPSQSLAELAQYNVSGSETITLFAEQLPPVNKGSPLLYKNLKVGRISEFNLVKNGVEVKVSIEKQYKHLLTENAVFWNYSGVEVDAGLHGINVKAAPLKSLIQGSIAFDSIAGVENKTGDKWLLYESFKTARTYGRTITLVAKGENHISKGTSVKYNGIKVGEAVSVTPDFKHETMTIKLRLLPEYADILAKQDSYFWIAQPTLGLSGVKNLQNFWAPAINVKPGSGKATFKFNLHKQPSDSDGIAFTLQSETLGAITIGTPILFRDMEVGRVIQVGLGEFADRVVSTISISPQYAYLIRKNSVFWNTSGVDVSIGLGGANIKAGTIDSIIKGGITFSTPDNIPLQPVAESGQSFFLNSTPEESWKTWRMPIPKP
ncbi:MlaD family protein [Vibrio aquimaris]|uniref:Paraquat-inducible protein B n=1 Tax=Vibrio aquimaris TaxID=2587862 RepID=A0A5P9CIR0_9VIBR|nr:MlaD family protein [Vibrio aquimaris]QFT26188.1 Paraquat-inducible protein B [Vibrio aquimaris]